MTDENMLKRAIELIEEHFKTREELEKASPVLNEMKHTLEWYNKVCEKIPEKRDSVLQIVSDAVENVLNMKPPVFKADSVQGATGSLSAVSGDTRTIIQSYGPKYHFLISEYDEINNIKNQIDRIKDFLKDIRKDLIKYNPLQSLTEADYAYEKWKAGSISNSDLAKDVRAFQDVFNGVLHKARIATIDPPPKNKTDPSWPKMADALTKQGGGCQKTLRGLQGKDDVLHLAFTEIMKKTREVDKSEMERYFKDYIEHVYAVINLIDEDRLK